MLTIHIHRCYVVLYNYHKNVLFVLPLFFFVAGYTGFDPQVRCHSATAKAHQPPSPQPCSPLAHGTVMQQRKRLLSL